MHVIPILSALRRHRSTAALIVFEIALTCAIVSNAIFLIGDRVSRMERASGLAEDELIRVQLSAIGKKPGAGALTTQDLNALRAIPGVKFAAVTNMIPFGSSSWASEVSTRPDDPAAPVNAAMYMGSPDLLETLGVQLTSGRDFTPDEYVDFGSVQAGQVRVPSIIISRGVAERLFPGKNPIGQSLYVFGKEPQIVVGVIDRLARPNQAGDPRNDAAFAIVVPVTVPYTVAGNYLLRVDSTRKAEVLASVDATLSRLDPSRIIVERRTFAEIRSDFFRQDRAMAYLLIGVSAALLIITALGIVGLASFWVQQRTRQIGIRRALGATRGDIVRYFQLENFLLATAGIVVGMVLAYAINLLVMRAYQVPRLPAQFLPIGAALLWLLGQIAVLGPALRASMIPPAIATRTV